jgi:hypothetical protein
MADVSLTLLVLKTRQVNRLLAFYQTLGIEFADEQHGKGLAITLDRPVRPWSRSIRLWTTAQLTARPDWVFR